MTPPCDHTAELAALTARVAALEAAREPIEPLYGIAEVALLLRCSIATVRLNLGRFAADLSEPRYRFDPRHRKYRMVPAADVRLLRARMVRRSLHDRRFAA